MWSLSEMKMFGQQAGYAMNQNIANKHNLRKISSSVPSQAKRKQVPVINYTEVYFSM